MDLKKKVFIPGKGPIEAHQVGIRFRAREPLVDVGSIFPSFTRIWWMDSFRLITTSEGQVSGNDNEVKGVQIWHFWVAPEAVWSAGGENDFVRNVCKLAL